MDASAIKLGDAFVRLGVNSAPLAEGLKKSYNAIYAFGDKVSKIVESSTLNWVGKITAVFAATKVFAAVGDNLDKMSLRTGIASQTLSEMDFALSQCGTNLETFEHAVEKMNRTLVESPQKFTALGLSIAKLKTTSPEKQFYAIIDALHGIDDQSQQTAAAISIFGRESVKLLPLIKNGVAGTDALRRMGQQLGIVMTKEDTDKAAAMTDAYDKLQRTLKYFAVSVGSIFADNMIAFTGTITSVVQWINEFTKTHQTLIQVISGTFGVFSGLVVSIFSVGAAIKTIGFSINWLAGGLQAFSNGLKSLGGGIKYITKYLSVTSKLILANKQAVASELLLNRFGIQRQSVLTKKCAQILLTNKAELAAAIQAKASAVFNRILYGSEVDLFKAKTASATASSVQTSILTKENLVKLTSAALTNAWNAVEKTCIAIQTLKNKIIGKNIFATAASTIETVKHTVALVAAKVATVVATVATYGFSAAVVTLNAAIAANPIGAAVIAVVALTAAVYGIISAFVGGETAAGKYAKKMHEAREAHDRLRETQQNMIELLEKLHSKEALSDKEKEQVKTAVDNLNSSYSGLNMTIDETTGKVNNVEDAIRNCRKEVSDFKTRDIDNELEATKARMDELAESLAYGTTGIWRWLGAWVTAGYVDTNDEVFNRMDPEEKIKEIERLLEEGEASWANWFGGFFGSNGGANSTAELKEELKRLKEEAQKLESEKIQVEIEAVVDFSDSFKDAEKEINELLEKDRRSKMSETDIKAEDIQKDFANRREKLELMVKEAEEYQRIGKLSQQQLDDLNKRKQLLETLNDEEKKRISLLYAQQAAEASQKLDEMDNAVAEESMSESDKKIAAIKKEFQERKKQLELYIEAANKQGELSEEERKTYEERRKQLENLKAAEEERINSYKQAEAAQQAAEASQKLDEMDNAVAEESMSESDKKIAAIKKEFQERKKLLELYLEAAKNQGELSEEERKTYEERRKQLENLSKAEQARIDALKQAEESQKEADKQAELASLNKSFAERRQAEKDKVLEQQWNDMAERNPNNAVQIAENNVGQLKKATEDAYQKLEEMIQSGATDEDKKAQKEKIDMMENELAVWKGRRDDVTIGKLRNSQPSAFSQPSIAEAGSLDAQRKFLENQQANKGNPMVKIGEEQVNWLEKIFNQQVNLNNNFALEGV